MEATFNRYKNMKNNEANQKWSGKQVVDLAWNAPYIKYLIVIIVYNIESLDIHD